MCSIIYNIYSAETQKNPDRQRSFSHWNSSYNFFNKRTEEEKLKSDFRPSSIDNHFKNRYHRYHVGCYKNEHHTALGVHGDIPFEKFFLKNQPKMHSSNYELSLGTTKPTNFIPGYAGFIPVNKFTVYNDRVKDPYFNVNKTNHMLNYHVRLPNYQGYIPQNPQNIKGNARPFCLSTKGETFN